LQVPSKRCRPEGFHFSFVKLFAVAEVHRARKDDNDSLIRVKVRLNP
jgi:hypothetical protein